MTTLTLPISRTTSNLGGWIVLAVGTALVIILIAVALLNMPAPSSPSRVIDQTPRTGFLEGVD
jgi:hypothetical protein